LTSKFFFTSLFCCCFWIRVKHPGSATLVVHILAELFTWNRLLGTEGRQMKQCSIRQLWVFKKRKILRRFHIRLKN